MRNRTYIGFSHKYSKLDKPLFTTIRWADYDVEKGKIYELKVKGRFLCLAKITDIVYASIRDLSDDFIRQDADCTREEFMALMQNWYSKKPDWKGADSMIKVIHLEKEVAK